MRLKTLMILIPVTLTAVDANDSNSVVVHWHHGGKAPIGEYLKILFRYYDYLQILNRFIPKVPNSIYVQSFVWNLYKNAGNADKLSYAANQYAVDLYSGGYRAKKTGNVQWLNETSYIVFDFPGFKNHDSSRKALWGLSVCLFNVEIENDTSTYNSTTDGTLKNDTNDTSKMPLKDENKTHRQIRNKNLTDTRKSLVIEKIGIRPTGKCPINLNMYNNMHIRRNLVKAQSQIGK